MASSRVLKDDEQISDLIEFGFQIAKNMTLWLPSLPKPPVENPLPPMPMAMPMPTDISNSRERGSLIEVEPFRALRSEADALSFAPNIVPSGTRLVAGGHRHFELLRSNVIDRLDVPNSDSFEVQDLLSEFDYPLSTEQCGQLVCAHPAVAVDVPARKLWLQLGLSSEIASDRFARPPLNLSLVIDTSRSMNAAKDGRTTLLQWIQRVAVLVLQQLKDGDQLSIVTFGTEPQTLLPPTRVTRKALSASIKKIGELTANGSDYVEGGLARGFELVERSFDPQHLNRVILVSDGVFHRNSDEIETIRELVQSKSNASIGLTTVAVGHMAEKEVLKKIADVQGGNSFFLDSEESFNNFSIGFDFLVTPIAYDLKALVKVTGLETKVSEIFGSEKVTVDGEDLSLENSTLFYSEQPNGGVILLQYDLTID